MRREKERERERERERVGSRLCFFYSSVIKQFNITNTGLDNTSAPMGDGGNHPRHPLLRLVHHPSFSFSLSLGTWKNVSFYFVHLSFSLFFFNSLITFMIRSLLFFFFFFSGNAKRLCSRES